MSCRKMIATTLESYVFYRSNVINNFKLTNRISFANVYFVEFEQVNVYLREIDV